MTCTPLLRPDYHYYAVHDATGVLVGFCCYGEDAQVAGGDYAAPALDVGMGLRPDLVGQGRAHGFLQAILAWGVETLRAGDCSAAPWPRSIPARSACLPAPAS
jgi:ribosomal-protein-alanine N-acetyltransferase